MTTRHVFMNEATETPDAAAPADDSISLPPAFAGQEEIDAAAGVAAEPSAEDGAEPAPEAQAAADPAAESAPDAGEDPALAALEELHALEGRQAPQQARPELTPDLLATAVARAVENSPANRLIQEAMYRQQQQAQAARAPQPPGPDSTAADWAKYAEASVAYTTQVQSAQFQKQLAPITQALQEMRQQTQRQELAQRQERYENALQTSLQALAQKPENAWMQAGDPNVVGTKQAIIRTLYERARGSMTLPQVVAEVARTFGVARPGPAVAANTARTNATAALKAQRAAVKTVPVAPSKGGSRASAPRGKEDHYRSKGMWDSLGPDLQALYREQDRRLKN